MIINKEGLRYTYNSTTYTIGAAVVATEESEYQGLYGIITEIRDDVDRETENDMSLIVNTSMGYPTGTPQGYWDIVFLPHSLQSSHTKRGNGGDTHTSTASDHPCRQMQDNRAKYYIDHLNEAG